MPPDVLHCSCTHCKSVASFCSLPYAAAGQEVGYDGVRYTRCNNNPSQEVVGAKLAALEGEQLMLCSIMNTTSVSLTF
jgi:O-acetylhomoserine/O-acetylserine sulfhydrylase-like pyridoxal-dependent enzyme